MEHLGDSAGEVIRCDCYGSGVVHVFSMGIVNLHEFLNVSFLLGEGEVENAEIVFVGLPKDLSTKRPSTSLFYSIRAS